MRLKRMQNQMTSHSMLFFTKKWVNIYFKKSNFSLLFCLLCLHKCGWWDVSYRCRRTNFPKGCYFLIHSVYLCCICLCDSLLEVQSQEQIWLLGLTIFMDVHGIQLPITCMQMQIGWLDTHVVWFVCKLILSLWSLSKDFCRWNFHFLKDPEPSKHLHLMVGWVSLFMLTF